MGQPPPPPLGLPPATTTFPLHWIQWRSCSSWSWGAGMAQAYAEAEELREQVRDLEASLQEETARAESSSAEQVSPWPLSLQTTLHGCISITSQTHSEIL